MKKIEYTENFEQANRIIEGEKAVLSDGCRGLILQDLSATLSRYFELSSMPEMRLMPAEKGFEVSLEFSAAMIKKFNVLK